MRYNELYAKAFKYGMMFGKDIKPGEAVSVSVTNVDDVVLAVKKAYIDMSPRTLRGEDGENKQALSSKDKEVLFCKLAQKIVQYMENGVRDFENWHKALCQYFIDAFEKILKNAGKNPSDATYGKAQKIINMTFKYLYCFDDAEKYADRFAPCHMALDSYTLNWVNGWFLDQYNQGKPRCERLSRTGKRHLPAWSNLEYETQNGGVPQYQEIQAAIRIRVQEIYQVPPIEAEFMIWYDERKKAEEKARDD